MPRLRGVAEVAHAAAGRPRRRPAAELALATARSKEETELMCASAKCKAIVLINKSVGAGFQ